MIVGRESAIRGLLDCIIYCDNCGCAMAMLRAPTLDIAEAKYNQMSDGCRNCIARDEEKRMIEAAKRRGVVNK